MKKPAPPFRSARPTVEALEDRSLLAVSALRLTSLPLPVAPVVGPPVTSATPILGPSISTIAPTVLMKPLLVPVTILPCVCVSQDQPAAKQDDPNADALRKVVQKGEDANATPEDKSRADAARPVVEGYDKATEAQAKAQKAFDDAKSAKDAALNAWKNAAPAAKAKAEEAYNQAHREFTKADKDLQKANENLKQAKENAALRKTYLDQTTKVDKVLKEQGIDQETRNRIEQYLEQQAKQNSRKPILPHNRPSWNDVDKVVDKELKNLQPRQLSDIKTAIRKAWGLIGKQK